MEKKFVHLHVHSEYTLLSGVNRISEIPKLAKQNGMSAVALTDTCNMFGAVNFFKSCVKLNISPIIGCEIFISSKDIIEKEDIENDETYTLVLLAKNEIGYKNLIHLVSIANTKTNISYIKPKISKKDLMDYSSGLIALSGGTNGEVEQKLLKKDPLESIEKICLWYSKIFKEDYYLELQDNGTIERKLLNQELINLGRKNNINVVATNDVYYPEKESKILKDVVECIKDGKKLKDIPKNEIIDENYFKSTDEMYNSFKEIPEALENTLKIAKKCKFNFEFGKRKLPHFEIPEEEKGKFENNLKYMTFKINQGLKKRYGNVKDVKYQKEIIQRAKYEMSIISNMGFVDYFLIVADFVEYAKKNDIPVGPGRGSGAGSLIAYLLGITEIDPLKYELFFERFLNPERVTMPDFDIDFCNEKRDDVISYVSKKYGPKHVTQIITFGTLSARMVVRDIGRILDISHAKVDKISKTIPAKPKITIEDALNMSKEFKELLDTDLEAKKIVELAKKIEGMPRNASTHASGVVVTNLETIEYVPLYSADGNVLTQYTMDVLEELGLLKIDFLGLRNLTVIDKTEKLIEKIHGIKIDYGNYDDISVFNLWKKGKTLGIFQFESQGITSVMKRFSPNSIDDIMAGTALYRPGPRKYISQYIEGKNDKTKIRYIHPSLKDILSVTNGCIVYQEQVMQIARKLAGYSYQKADLLRKAMSKKKKEIIDAEKETFIAGCRKNGISENISNEIFNSLQEFANYAFNKSHSACYAHISYQTAYLKRYYPAEFFVSIMNSYNGNLEKIPLYIEDARNFGIEVLPPDINESYTDFSVRYVEGKPVIRFGLSSIKNVGIAVAQEIVKLRKEKKFENFKEFLTRTKKTSINKRGIESLILAGALNGFEQNQKTLYLSYEKILEEINKKDEFGYIEGQSSFFEMIDKAVPKDDTKDYEIVEDFSDIEKMTFEKEMIGIYISLEPLRKVYKYFKNKINFNSKNFKDITQIEEENMNNINISKLNGKRIITLGMIENIQKKYSKKGNLLVKVKLCDIYGQMELIIFESTYLRIKHNLYEGNIVGIDGKISILNTYYSSIIVNNLYKVERK